MANATRAARNGRSKGATAPRRPEKTFRVGNCYATIWCNEIRPESGSDRPPRIMRSVNLERRFWNDKLKEGKGDYDAATSFSLGDIHNAIAVMQLAAEHLRNAEAEVTRDADATNDVPF